MCTYDLPRSNHKRILCSFFFSFCFLLRTSLKHRSDGTTLVVRDNRAVASIDDNQAIVVILHKQHIYGNNDMGCGS